MSTDFFPTAVKDPFLVHGPAVVSLSGGRTSAFMLRKIIDAGLQPDVHVLFCNTGKEYGETLAFVDEIARRWRVEVRWLEYDRKYMPVYKKKEVAEIAERLRTASGRLSLPRPTGVREPGFREVTFETAAADGGPYRNFVEMNGLPNPATRTCTTELKVRVMKKFMLARGYESWDMVMGIRADEPRRVAKLSHSPPERWEHVMPLAEAKVTEADVLAFWQQQEFDLGLPVDPLLRTYRGNCDGCILKATDKLLRIGKEEPERLDWWAQIETESGSVFRRDRPNYTRLKVLAQETTSCGVDDDLGDCFCHD